MKKHKANSSNAVDTISLDPVWMNAAHDY